MATSEERIKILKMLEAGKLSAEEAARLLKALTRAKPEARTAKQEGEPRWLRVRVTAEGGEQTKVNVNLPISLVNVGLRLGAKYIPEEDGMDIQEIRDSLDQALQAGMTGKVVDLVDEEEGHRIEIYLE